MKVPDVAGQSFEDAQAELEAKGLNAVREDEASDTVPPGQVTRTDPPADAKIDRGSNVTVFVSAGPAPVNVPNVDGTGPGRGDPDAERRRLQGREDEPSRAAPSRPARSSAPTPPRASQAPRGSTVTIIVSTGPEQVTVPNVVGRTQADATSALTDAGFDVAGRARCRRPRRTRAR